MTGIVAVSHSAKLAESVLELAMEMGRDHLKVASAGGVDDPENPIGTDAMKIFEAIEKVYSDDGVLVFMDMGSAIMSTELALDFFDEERRSNIHLCEAPFVEGIVAATALAATGAGIEEIIEEARFSVRGKASQLGVDYAAIYGGGSTGADAESGDKAIGKEFTLKNTMGLHARPAARLVAAIAQAGANVRVRNLSKGSAYVSGRSMNSLLSLNAQQHDVVELLFPESGSEALMAEIAEMFQSNFGESTAPAPRRRPSLEKEAGTNLPENGLLTGLPISPGYAVGPVVKRTMSLPDVEEQNADDPQAEQQLLEDALEKAAEEIETIKRQSIAEIGEEDAAIFDAQILLLRDPELLSGVEERIIQGKTAASAWRSGLNDVVSLYQNIGENTLLSTRMIDLIDVGIRVLENITGIRYSAATPDQPSILCMNDISPSDAASLEPDKVLAICCESGSDVSHSAIIARSLGIPTIFNIGKIMHKIPEGEMAAVNAETGELFVNPDQAVLARIATERERWLEVKQKAHLSRKEKGQTGCGTRLRVLANVGNEHEINQVLDLGAEGVGLFRTEFLFMERTKVPDEQEQFEAYKLAAKALGKKRPLTIRTLDVGGDKPVPYLHIEGEENPFLGRRGIRYCLDERDLFKTQLRAILRASAYGHIEIMFPMIANIGELEAAFQLLDEAAAELDAQNQKYDKDLKKGIMVEVPAAVENLKEILPLVDFVSIGTNDLSQYVMAADRTNAAVSGLASYYQPAVLRVIERVIRMANESGTDVSMCGEMARDTLVSPLLVAWGLRKYSMSAAGIPEFKYMARKIHQERFADLSGAIAGCTSPDEVRETLRRFAAS
ncbi:phosphoenolpyruvate-protein phosphotransferase [Cyclonatronum proteinivorum]|uniref:Phosphoenolpyruvate-protein phosphotransferase n=1 Tax=Cyclonatronum proteinivorum TaxID=1457365 RepID=A0A345UP65_9BACT|nr:phosphoenolpyruvate--protein phosphotransferase [Cyclonatronum proteinivorum]AXJ02267.1 phosphoenolpyruvate-protein phosphotransferase [Cyclonatronum proteinivorum]